MKLTAEQNSIIQAQGNCTINAVAGSGKTSTLIEYARARNNQKILYLAFNKMVKEEAIDKFAQKGITNVSIETAHSLAHRHIVRQANYQVRSDYKASELVDILDLEGISREPFALYMLASHITKFSSYFCNSTAERVTDLDYRSVISDPKAHSFVERYYEPIERGTRQLLAGMKEGKIKITHDFYLKLFQLSNPKLPFDCILFDEGQDASGAMLDIFMKQKATKVIVGDTHQQIYGWRFAINSLEKTDFNQYSLSNSFRFNEDIAYAAMKVLRMKSLLGAYNPVQIFGAAQPTGSYKTFATLARSNFGLLTEAIDFVVEKKEVDKIFFEGNIDQYTATADGISLNEVLNLYNGNSHIIKNKMLKACQDFDTLKQYIEKAEDREMGILVDLVEEYRNEIHYYIGELKKHNVAKEEKHSAEMIYSTVHKCKGLEYDEVTLANDFIQHESLQQLITEHKLQEQDVLKLKEEINILYVAITRAKNKLHIPENLLPQPVSLQIKPIEVPKEKEEAREVNVPEVLRPYDYTAPMRGKQGYNFLEQNIDDEELMNALKEIAGAGIELSPYYVTKILMGSRRKSIRPGAQRLNCFARLKGSVRHSTCKEYITDFFDKYGDYVYELSRSVKIPQEPVTLGVSGYEKWQKTVEGFKLEKNTTDLEPRIQEIRKRYARAYEPWLSSEIQLLKDMVENKLATKDISEILKRNHGAVESAIKHFLN